VILIRGDLDKIGAKISPNPFRGNLNVSFQVDKEEMVTIRVYNQAGQLVKQQTARANAGVNTVNVNDLAVLPAGNYTFEVKTSKATSRQQIVKQ
jgi:flagellar hook assembly protein FlgD